MQAKQRSPFALVFVLLVAILPFIAIVFLDAISGKPFPECDNPKAQAALALLYDNKRLLHAIDVGSVRHLNDSMTRRHCSAIVKWGNGSESEVQFEFDSSAGRSGSSMSMWIDYNGGTHGPSY